MNLRHVQLDNTRHLALSVSLKFEVLPMEDILSSVQKVTAPCWMKLSRWFTNGMKGSVGLEVIKFGWRTGHPYTVRQFTFWSYQQTRAMPVLWATDAILQDPAYRIIAKYPTHTGVLKMLMSTGCCPTGVIM